MEAATYYTLVKQNNFIDNRFLNTSIGTSYETNINESDIIGYNKINSINVIVRYSKNSMVR